MSINSIAGAAVNTLSLATQRSKPVEMAPEVASTASMSDSSSNPVADPYEALPVYEKPSVDIGVLRNSTQTTLAATQMANALLTTVNNTRTEKTVFSVGQLLQQVAGLSAEANEYRNEARTYRVSNKVSADKFTPDFTRPAGKLNQSVSISLRTQEGDKIDINIAHHAGSDGDSVEFSYVVDGKLSERERAAMDKLLKKLGTIADDFFRTDTAELHGLKDLDTEAIADFHITISRPKGDTYVDFTYDFSIDIKTQTQHVSGKDVNGYKFDIQSSLLNLLNQPNSASSDIVQQYVDLIQQSTKDARTPNASTRFLLDGFTSVFGYGVSEITNKPKTKTEDILSAFNSGLPDFSASFTSAVEHEPGQYLYPTSMSLRFSQRTTVEQQSDRFLIEQATSYEFTSNQITGLPGMENGDTQSGNFNYQTIYKAGENKRILDMEKDKINNLMEEKTAEVSITDLAVINFHRQDKKTYTDSDRQFSQLADMIKQKQLNDNIPLLTKTLNDTKNSLFITLVK